MTGDKITDAGCTYRALRRSALHEVPVFNGMHRFLPTLLRLQGYRVTEILVNHRPRTRGTSKYGVGNRLWRGIVDCFAMRWFRARRVRGDRAQGG
jgi:dolichol-phosphate mannosyltransferase